MFATSTGKKQEASPETSLDFWKVDDLHVPIATCFE